MAAYLLASTTAKDEDLYAQYGQLAGQSAVEFGIEEVVVDDNAELLEGQRPGSRIVILKFRDKDAIKEWYDSPLYRKAREIRAKAADTAFLMILNPMR